MFGTLYTGLDSATRLWGGIEIAFQKALGAFLLGVYIYVHVGVPDEPPAVSTLVARPHQCFFLYPAFSLDTLVQGRRGG